MSKKKRTKPRREARPSPAAAPAAVVSPHPRKQIPWTVVIAVLEPLSIVGFSIYLLTESWLRWMDPLIDFPKDLYLAWRVSEGDLLFRDVTTWYGPLPQLTEGAGFRLFGAGIDTIVWMNIALTAAVVIMLRNIFRALGNRLSGWLAT